MTREDLILPILKASDWPGQEASIAHKLSVPSDDPRLPWVAYGRWNQREFEPLPGKGSDEVDEELKREALRNLHDLPASWQPLEGGGGSAQPTMLACLHDSLAVERIRDTDFMLKAHEELGTEILAVGIPRRGHLVAIDGRQPDASLTRFGAYNLGQYHSRESEPISSLTILMEEAEFAGLLQFTG